MSAPHIPADVDGQAFMIVKPILAGNLFLPDKEVFQDSIDLPDTEGIHIPVFCFFLSHPTKGNVLFDLGVRKHAEGYPPVLHDTIFKYFFAKCDEDITDSLKKGGENPGDVHSIFLSHLHWDHTGDPRPFTSAEIFLGAASKAILENDVYPENPDGEVLAFPEGNSIVYLDYSPSYSRPVVAPFASFDRAVDFFGDGSLYIVDTPGHFPGHLSAVARVAPNSFVFLAGDLCHNRLCYSPGHRALSQLNYRDVDTARATAQKLAKLNRESENVIVILAHEKQRLEEGMPLFPKDVREWAIKEVEKRKVTQP